MLSYIKNLSSDAQTQINSKQFQIFNDVSGVITSNISNYSYDFRRSDGTGQNFLYWEF